MAAANNMANDMIEHAHAPLFVFLLFGQLGSLRLLLSFSCLICILLLIRFAILRVFIILRVDQRPKVLTTEVDVGLVRILRLVHLLTGAMRKVIVNRLKGNVQELKILTAF